LTVIPAKAGIHRVADAIGTPASAVYQYALGGIALALRTNMRYYRERGRATRWLRDPNFTE